MSPPLQTNLFINGSYLPSSTGDTLSIYSPVDDSLVSDQVQVASEADVDRAVAAARAAFPAWRDTAGHKRAKCMLRFAEILERESGRLAELGEKPFIYYLYFIELD
jgi:aldehyde dehydrogenase (NAD+)